MSEFRAHSEKQYRAISSSKRIVVCATGIQWGKSTSGGVRTKKAMHTFRSRDDAFILAAPNYKIMMQSSLPVFLKLMEGCGKFNKADMIFEMFGGGKCYMRTNTEPDSVVGITNVRHIWGDEAGKFTYYFWENLQGRASFKECPITLTTSPYALNWVYKELIKKSGARDDLEIIQASSIENPYFPEAEYYAKEKTMDSRRFRMMYGGRWERMAGLVYDCFDEHENQCDEFALPQGTLIVGGIDWGYTEPFVLKLRAITLENEHFSIGEFYKSGLTIDDICKVCVGKAKVTPIARIYCGPDQPAHIEALNRAFHQAGLKTTAMAADNNVRLGIDRHYELIKTRRLKYFRGLNPNSLDELDTYHYPEIKDLGPDQDAKPEKPVEQNDHASDADRYISVETWRGFKLHQPIYNNQYRPEVLSQVKRIEKLKKRKNLALEDFSYD